MSRYLLFSPRMIQRLKRVQAYIDALQPEAEPIALTLPGSPQPRDGVIIFTGSFNPPTNAHLAMLKAARTFAQQQKKPFLLYAAMSKHTVNKEQVERPTMLDRIVLLQTLLRRIPQTGILLFNRGLYVEQATALRRSFPKVKRILFLIGFDKIVQILDPAYYEDRDAALNALFHMAELLVAPRGDAGQVELQELLGHPENQRFARFIHPLPFNSIYRNISSTKVRERKALQEVPQEVRRFIQYTKVYDPPQWRNNEEFDFYGERIKRLQKELQEC
jgi:nicotinic acid mononucleotide adenylyltransferase